MCETHCQLPAICIFAPSKQFLQMKLIRILYITLLSIILIPGLVTAQVNVKDSALNVSMFYPTYAFGKPGGDLSERYGYSHQIGVGYMYKAKSNWTISFEGDFIFRDGIKDPASILSNISTSDGFIIDEGGVFANVMLMERGYALWVKIGKIIPIAGSNPNSGLLLQLGGGMLQHKIKIEDPNNSAPQLKGDYKKGYDHMCNGPSISQFIGYHNLSNSRKVNFYAGVEFVQAFTSSRRSYYFNEMVRPDEKRIDLLNSLKVGWYIPLYKKTQQKYYYY
jgi:hypothetical protein